MVKAEIDPKRHPWSAGTRGRAGGLEDYPLESTASAVSDELIKLPLRPNANSVSDLHAMGGCRAGTRTFPLRVFGNAWPIGTKLGPREEPSASYRILHLGRWVGDSDNRFGPLRQNCTSITAGG